MTHREELISLYSDLSKDLNGFRPNLDWTLDCPIEELERKVDKVATWLHDQIEELDAELDAELARAAELEALREGKTIEALSSDLADFPTAGNGWSFTPAAEVSK